MNIEVGKIYKINHSRKGTFTAEITSTDSEWTTAVVVEGVADGISNNWTRGEELSMRNTLIVSAAEVAG